MPEHLKDTSTPWPEVHYGKMDNLRYELESKAKHTLSLTSQQPSSRSTTFTSATTGTYEAWTDFDKSEWLRPFDLFADKCCLSNTKLIQLESVSKRIFLAITFN